MVLVLGDREVLGCWGDSVGGAGSVVGIGSCWLEASVWVWV